MKKNILRRLSEVPLKDLIILILLGVALWFSVHGFITLIPDFLPAG